MSYAPYRDTPPVHDVALLLEQRDQAADLRHLGIRLDDLSDRVAQISRRVDRQSQRHRELEMRVERIVEIAKWIAFAAMMLAGLLEKLPDPLRARLFGG